MLVINASVTCHIMIAMQLDVLVGRGCHDIASNIGSIPFQTCLYGSSKGALSDCFATQLLR